MIDERPWVQHYQPGVPADIPTPTTSLVEMCEEAVAKGGDGVALQFFGRETSFRELGEQISRAAEGLRRLGVRTGDRVALILPNCPQHVVAFYAALRLGAIVVEHNPLYTARELRHLFEDHGARVVVAWDAAVAKIREQPSDIEVEHIVSVNLLRAFPLGKRLALHLPVPKLRATRARLTQPAPGTMPWEDLLRAPALDSGHPRPTVDDVAVIQYTSGTTGRAKGAILTHCNLYANALQGAAWMHDAVDGREVIYAVLPMFHAFGMTLYLTFGILKRARIVLFPSFDADLVLDAARTTPPTVYCAVPPIYEKTALRARERKISLRSAKYCISGAMNLPDAVVERWEAVSGGLLVEGYGMTEASPVCLGNPFAPSRRTGTIGVPFPSTQMLVVDPDDPTREVAQGERGELLIKGPGVTPGYWRMPEFTAKTIVDGWLHTGDVAMRDEDGYYYIVDRLKDMFISGGENVYPAEVENVIYQLPQVAETAVIGVPDEKWGEVGRALVAVKAGQTLTEAQVIEHCRANLGRYKVPRSVVFVQALPRNPAGKVVKGDLRALYGKQ